MKKTVSFLLGLAMCAAVLPVQAADPMTVAGVKEYDGQGTAVAVIDTGFWTEHAVFSTDPASPKLTSADVSENFDAERYYSAKIPYAYDYADGDTEVLNTSPNGTAAASLIAGYSPAVDTQNEDGTWTRTNAFYGKAYEAQLLLMKCAVNGKTFLMPDMVASAINDAVTLGADVIFVNWNIYKINGTLRSAVETAEKAGIPIFTGAGKLDTNTFGDDISTALALSNALSPFAELDGVTVIGSLNDPFAYITDFIAKIGDTETEISYYDSCESYIGSSFATLMNGGTYEAVVVPNVGTAEDFATVNVEGKVAVVRRGTIPFTEKCANAAEAGAVAVIVVNTDNENIKMVLDEDSIPAVIVSKAQGEKLLTATAPVTLTFRRNEQSRNADSSFGVSPTAGNAIFALCEGTGIVCANQSREQPFTTASGSHFSAALAAGYAACAAQYANENTLSRSAVLPLLRTLVQKTEMSALFGGTGILTDGSFSALLLDAQNTITHMNNSTTARTTATLTNSSDTAVTVTLSAETSVLSAEDGNLTGGKTQLPASVYIGDSVKDLTGTAYTVTVQPHKTVTLPVTVFIDSETQKELNGNWANGFWAETTLTAEADGKEIPLSLLTFVGDWNKRPFTAESIYDTTVEEAGYYLSAYSYNDGSYVLLGTAGRYVAKPDSFTQKLNIVNPANMRSGWVSLMVCESYRTVESVSIVFTDEDGRKVFENTRSGFQPSIFNGEAEIPLWDFIAADGSGYEFPAGKYECTVTLHANGVKEDLHFTFYVDDTAPVIEQYEYKTENGKEYITVSVSDGVALNAVTVTDVVHSFEPKVSITGETAATVTVEITKREKEMPLYINVSDYAGNYKVIRVNIGD